MDKLDRLKLLNQFIVLSKLDPRNGWERQAKIVENGYSGEYDSLFRPLMPELTEAECKFVIDVLSMFDALQRPYYTATPKVEVPLNLQFDGFDGNGEGGFLNYCRFLVRDEGRFAYLSGRGIEDGNSHYPSREVYDRMLARWDDFDRRWQLTADEIQEVSDASRHPENAI